MANMNQNQGKVNQQRQHYNDKSQNYQHSNQRNPDNIRDNTRDKQYKDYDETLTNDENFDVDTQKIQVDAEFDDKSQNVAKNDPHAKDNE